MTANTYIDGVAVGWVCRATPLETMARTVPDIAVHENTIGGSPAGLRRSRSGPRAAGYAIPVPYLAVHREK